MASSKWLAGWLLRLASVLVVLACVVVLANGALLPSDSAKPLDSGVVALRAALIGAGAAIGGAVLSQWMTNRLEYRKWLRNRQDAIENDLRGSFQQLTIKMSAALHSMCWLTWRAKNGPTKITQANIDTYDNEIHDLLPQIMGLQALIAASDQQLFAPLSDLVKTACEIDVSIGNASLQYVAGDSNSVKCIADCYEMAITMNNSLSQKISEIISQHEQTTGHSVLRPQMVTSPVR